MNLDSVVRKYLICRYYQWRSNRNRPERYFDHWSHFLRVTGQCRSWSDSVWPSNSSAPMKWSRYSSPAQASTNTPIEHTSPWQYCQNETSPQNLADMLYPSWLPCHFCCRKCWHFFQLRTRNHEKQFNPKQNKELRCRNVCCYWKVEYVCYWKVDCNRWRAFCECWPAWLPEAQRGARQMKSSHTVGAAKRQQILQIQIQI